MCENSNGWSKFSNLQLEMFNVADFFVALSEFFSFENVLISGKRVRNASRFSPARIAFPATITSCTMHRTFRGAKRSTGARLEQKLVQLTSPGHAPAASPSVVSSFCQRRRFPIPNESPIFHPPRKEANPSLPPGDEKKTGGLMPMIVELARPARFLDTIEPGMALGRTSDDLGTSCAYIDMFLYGRDEIHLFWALLWW